MKDAPNLLSTRDAEVVKLTLAKLPARKVKDKLGINLTARQVQRIASKHLGPVSNANPSIENAIASMRPYIESCLELLGKDPHICEICAEKQDGKCDIHHTRYEGATVYDLQYVCRSCNLARMNRGLK